MSFRWRIKTFNGVKSIQRGERAISAVSTDITISPVDLIKSRIFLTYNNPSNTTFQPTWYLKNPTTLTIENPGSGIPDIAYQIVDFN